MFKMRCTMLCHLLVLIIVLTACQPNIPWNAFNSTKGNFSILMPTTPTEDSVTEDMGVLGKIGVFTYTVEESYGAFIVAYSDFPADVMKQIDPYTVLDAGVTGFSSFVTGKAAGKILSTKSISWKNRFPGREFRAQTENGDAQAVGRAYLINARLYVILGEMPTGGFSDSEMNKFLDSFDLLKS